jgi:hypothetical protein
MNESVDLRDWSLEVGTGVLISDVRTDLPGYTLAPAFLMASTAMDEISLDDFAGGIFRGYTEFYFTGFGMAVINGTESRFVGISLGPRYNFCQPGWKVVPYIEGLVGFAFNDSQGARNAKFGDIGQGQDFSFQFGIDIGARYDFNKDWYMRVAAVYTHFSNAGLSDPEHKNRALDAAGPQISFGRRF